VHALCNVKALLTNGILRMRELADAPEESFIAKCIYCHCIYFVSSDALAFVEKIASTTFLPHSSKWFLTLKVVLWKVPTTI
jgi:hypothetical protein